MRARAGNRPGRGSIGSGVHLPGAVLTSCRSRRAGGRRAGAGGARAAAPPVGTATPSTEQPASPATGSVAKPAATAQTATAGGRRPDPVPPFCIGCHSPTGRAAAVGACSTGRWLAPNITPDPISGIGAWSRDELFAYLRDGARRAEDGRAARWRRWSRCCRPPDEEIEALVDWMLAQPPHRDPADEVPASERGEPLKMDSAELQGAAFVSGETSHTGVALYNGACASCHGRDGAGSRDGRFPSLFHNSSVGRTPPRNLVAALLEGIERHLRDETVLMQSFDATKGVPGGLADRDLAELANFVVKQFGNPAAATLASQDINRARLEWWGEGEPTAAQGELIAVGGGSAEGICFNCHGLQGQGDADFGTPRLAGLEISYFAKQMRDYALGLRPNDVMSGIAQSLTQLDYQSLALYYHGLPPAAPIAGASPDAALLAAGEKLHREGAPDRDIAPCADCHGETGGGIGAVYPSLAQPGSYTAVQLHLWRDGTRRNDPHQLMSALSQQLTDDDISAVSAYLAGLTP